MHHKKQAFFTGVFGTVYALWLIYAAGLNYLLMAVILIAAGYPVYVWARKEMGVKGCVLAPNERYLAIGIFAIASFALYALAHHMITL